MYFIQNKTGFATFEPKIGYVLQKFRLLTCWKYQKGFKVVIVIVDIFRPFFRLCSQTLRRSSLEYSYEFDKWLLIKLIKKTFFLFPLFLLSDTKADRYIRQHFQSRKLFNIVTLRRKWIASCALLEGTLQSKVQVSSWKRDILESRESTADY